MIEPWNDDVEPTYYDGECDTEPWFEADLRRQRVVHACIMVAVWIGLAAACATFWYVVGTWTWGRV
jgi:hypothetical protein